MIRMITKAAVIAAFLIALSPAALAESPEVTDLTNTFRDAGAAVDRLQVYEISGIVIIRGRTSDKDQAAQLSRFAQSLGYARVANLVQTVEHDDQALTRAVERELTIHRALDGCKFRVSAAHGVVSVAGSVRHELQKDVAKQILRTLDGVRSVEVNLQRF